jgi:hypothetical protein
MPDNWILKAILPPPALSGSKIICLVIEVLMPKQEDKMYDRVMFPIQRVMALPETLSLVRCFV